MAIDTATVQEGVSSIDGERPRTVKPLPGQVLIRLLPHDSSTTGGLHIPDIVMLEGSGKKFPRKGYVVAIGRWRQVKSGHHILPDFHVGQLVLINEYLCEKLKSIGDEYRICLIDNVLAMFENPT